MPKKTYSLGYGMRSGFGACGSAACLFLPVELKKPINIYDPSNLG